MSKTQPEDDISFINRIFYAIKMHDNKIISFENITDFSWDSVCIFPPYSPDISINTALGFNWELSGNTNLQHDDVNCLIVFIKDKSVVKYLLYPRSKGDFSTLTECCYLKEEADYNVEERDNNGKIWYTIKNFNTGAGL